MKSLSNEIMKVIRETVDDLLEDPDISDDEMRTILENHCEIENFDGGVFVAYGNELDLFVLPHRRGKWRIRSILGDYLRRMQEKHDTIVVRIRESNSPSLRLAKGFGFVEIDRTGDTITLERK